MGDKNTKRDGKRVPLDERRRLKTSTLKRCSVFTLASRGRVETLKMNSPTGPLSPDCSRKGVCRRRARPPVEFSDDPPGHNSL
jgi:hypothetical protein